MSVSVRKVNGLMLAYCMDGLTTMRTRVFVNIYAQQIWEL